MGKAVRRSFRVNLCRIKEFFLDDRLWVAGKIELLEKKASIPRRARPGTLLHVEKQGITITIRKPTNQLLSLAAGFALEPEFLTRAAPIVQETRFQGFGE